MVKLFIKRHKILFSDKYNWKKNICRKLNNWRYEPSFNSFSEVDLDQFDLLIPQHLTDIVFLIEHRQELHRKKCFIPPLSALNTCNDKMHFNNFMTDLGFNHMIPQMNGTLSYPYILKKRCDENGSRSKIINTLEEEKLFQKFILSSEYFTQECIQGDEEFTTHILMVDGEIVFHRALCFTFNEQLFVKGVGCKPLKRRILHSCPYINTFATILKHLKFEGLCCFNFKVTDGDLKIFEINPRYGGSLTQFVAPMLKTYSNSLKYN